MQIKMFPRRSCMSQIRMNAVGIVIAIIYSVVYLWPKYIQLFRDLNSIK